MPCCHPLKAFYTGSLTDNGKPDYLVMPSTAGNRISVSLALKRKKVITPSANIIRENGHTYLTDPIAIPCGHCVGCRMDKAKAWKVRLAHECEKWPRDQIHFVTLTYRDACIPRCEVGMYLSKKDLRGFIRSFRQPEFGVYKNIKFFACGEYGTAENGTHRPHYHLILFGPLDDLIPYAPGSFHSAAVSKAWPYGLHDVKEIHPNMLAYVAGYTEKKQNDVFWNEYPVKPFLIMSRNLGNDYENRLDGSPDRKVYGNFGSVRSASIPRAYLRHLENEPWFAEFKAKSMQIGKDIARLNMAAFGTKSEEKVGDIQEAAQIKALENLRKVTL